MAAIVIEDVVADLLSSDIKRRSDTLGQLLTRLEKHGKLSGKKDALIRLMTELCHLRDTNPKNAIQTLQCLRLLMHLHTDSFETVERMAFDAFCAKYSESKNHIRTMATENVVILVGTNNRTGLQTGIDKLLSNLEFNKQSAKVKEQILLTILLLHSIYGHEVAALCAVHGSSLLQHLATLLGDSTISVRQLAIDTLAVLHAHLGDDLLINLENRGIRIAVLEKIQEAVLSGSCHLPLQAAGFDTDGIRSLISSNSNSSKGSTSAWEEIDGGRSDFAVKKEHVMSDMNAHSTVPSGFTRARTVGSSGSDSKPPSLSAMQRPFSSSVGSPSQTNHQSSDHASVGTGSTTVFSVGGGVKGEEIESLYCPQHYVNLLKEGTLPAPARVYSEKDLCRAFGKVTTNLNNIDDWNVRMQGLTLIQSLVLGDAMEFETELLVQFRTIIDILVAQVTDLRSVVSKEASRTVALIAIRMGPCFAALADHVVPALFRLTVVKIKIISSAADRAIRCILSTSPTGYPRVMTMLLDQCETKSSALRRVAFEYICLCCALWQTSVLEKFLPILRRVIRSGVVDADAGVRRVARHLLWVLHSTPLFEKTIDALKDGLDIAAQKHLLTELQASLEKTSDKRNNDSELSILLARLKETKLPFSPDLERVFACLDDSGRGRGGGSGASEGKSSPDDRERDSESRKEDSRNNVHPTGTGTCKEAGAEAVVQPYVIGGSGGGASKTLLRSKAQLQAKSAANTGVSVRVPAAVSANVGAVMGASVGASVTDVSANISSSASASSNASRISKFKVLEDRYDDKDRYDSATVLSSASAPARVSAHVPAAVKQVSMGIGGPAARIIRNGTGTDTCDKAASAMIVPASASAPTTTIFTVGPSSPSSPSGNGIAHVCSDNSPTGTPVERASMYNHVTLDALQAMSTDEHWVNRARSLEIAKLRLQQGQIGAGDIPVSMLSSHSIHVYIELAIAHVGDTHQRVAAEALACLAAVVEKCAEHALSRLSPLLVALFYRLSDRRQPVREQANSLLNCVRVAYEPVALVAALSPRILDLPERLRTTVVQFLSMTVPHCGTFFAVPQNTSVFLGRMASVLGAGGSKPTSAMLVAGRRLLEMTYNTAPAVVCAQIAALPLQQQGCIKRMLEPVVPAIDALVSAAAHAAPLSRSPAANNHASSSSATPGTPATPSLSSPLRAAHSYGYRQGHKQDHDSDSDIGSGTGIHNNDNSVTTPAIANSSTSLPQYVSPVASSSISNAVLGSTSVTANQHIPSTSTSTSIGVPTCFTATHVLSPEPIRDIVWLLESLATDAIRGRKLDALRELKTLARTADSAYWQQNCAQIISVLLEAFTRPDTSTISIATADEKMLMKGLKENQSPQHDGATNTDASSELDVNRPMANAESMHTSCKALLLLVRHRPTDVAPFTDLLAAKLCQAAAFAPVAVSLHCEQILIDLAPRDALRLLNVILPYTVDPAEPVKAMSPGASSSSAHVKVLKAKGTSPAVRLVALHVLAETLKNMPSPHLLPEVPTLVHAVLPSLTCTVVDLRKAVVFVLVEAYMLIGDALYPYIKDLPPPQKKLLTIYIDRQLQKSKK